MHENFGTAVELHYCISMKENNSVYSKIALLIPCLILNKISQIFPRVGSPSDLDVMVFIEMYITACRSPPLLIMFIVSRGLVVAEDDFKYST